MADELTSVPTDETPGKEPETPGEPEAELSETETMRQKIAELELSLEQMKDQLLRKAAEFENYRKRVENENESLRKYASEAVLTKLLPVLDDFERSMKARRSMEGNSTADDGFMRGMELIFNKLKKILELQGLKHFDVVGKPFDPEFHDALMQVYREGAPSHTVVEEVGKGYMLYDKVLRHARVIVSADQPAPEQAGSGTVS